MVNRLHVIAAHILIPKVQTRSGNHRSGPGTATIGSNSTLDFSGDASGGSGKADMAFCGAYVCFMRYVNGTRTVQLVSESTVTEKLTMLLLSARLLSGKGGTYSRLPPLLIKHAPGIAR
jgi:hypothetical protein